MDKEKSRVKKEISRGNDRTRNWTFVLYEDSAPDNWRDILDEYHIEWVESPWHDKDVNGDGQPKKKHKHIALLFAGVKTFEQVKEITDKVHSPIPQRAHSARALVRYMAHLDNPEKAQYNVSDIIGHGGVDVGELLKASSSERYVVIREMITYIRDNDITEFEDLMCCAMSDHFDDWFPLLCDNSTYVITEFIKSRRNRAMMKRKHIDIETGEIIE